VALKVVKPGLDSAQVIRRFEAERQALALMDHTNIAKVLDAGTTTQGRPYFVMELVKGVPITKYCDELHLRVRERLELLVPVCQAIQHAHQKGIVHRDIKPSNVLVSIQDGKPVAKVIDFGVAKALHQRLTEESMYTEIGQIVGTLEYMSPEQAELSALDIDTRADVYALGVLLYELLTGSTPLDKKRLRGAAFTEMLRMIKEEEPPKPSTRLTESKESLPALAAQRRTEPVKLTNAVRGELDWIVMKCLEKDRTRRYETADGLARDIERHLRDEPVDACPPGTGYRLGKFLRRHKGPVLAASLVFLALILGLAGTAWGLLRADRQRQLAESAATDERRAKQRADEQHNLAEEQKLLALANEKKAVAEKQIAEAVQTFLQRDLLRQADATAQANAVRQLGGGFEVKANPTIKELLDRAAAELTPAKIDVKFPGQREAQASILQTVGDTYRAIGANGQALELLTRSSDVSRQVFGADHPRTLAAENSLALAYLGAGKTQQAIELFEHVGDVQGKQLGAEHPDTLHTLSGLAWAYLDAGKLPQAIQLYEKIRDGQLKQLGPDHPDTLSTLHYLAGAYLYSGKTSQAIALYERALAARLKRLGADHPDTLATLNNLAVAYQDAGKLPEAIQLLEQVRKARLQKLGAEHPDTLSTLNFLATVYRAAGKPEQALPLLQQAAETMEKRKFQHQYARPIAANLMDCYEQLQRPAEAEALRRKWLAAVKEQAGAESPAYASELASLGLSLLKKTQWADAEHMLRECLTIREKTQPNEWTTFNTKSMLGESLARQKKYADAEALLLTGYEGMKQRAAAIPANGKVRLTEAAQRLVQLYEATGKTDQANEWRKLLR